MKITLLITILTIAFSSSAQTFKIKGTVYDSSRIYPVELVSVLSSSGKGTFTNEDGNYEIEVTDKDSIWFSYLNKPTMKFPVMKILNPFGFDIALRVNIGLLKEVKIRQRNYKEDSVQNRKDYAKVFDYQKPKLKPSISNMGVGFDVNEIINMFRFKRNRSMLAFQRRLILQEQEKSIDHRFNKALVRRLTGMTGNELDSFMVLYRPSYYFTLYTSDYDFQQHIKESYRRFINGLPPLPTWRPEDEDDQ